MRKNLALSLALGLLWLAAPLLAAVAVKQLAWTITPVTAVSSSGTMGQVVLADTTSNSITLTIPDCASGIDGQEIIVKHNTRGSTNTVTIDPTGADTIDGASTLVLTTEKSSVDLICDATNNDYVVH